MGQSPPPRTRVWIARSAYTYFHLPMIAGIIAVARADELMVAYPGDRGTAASVALTIGATALFFAGHALFKWAVFGVTPESIERPGLLVTPALLMSTGFPESPYAGSPAVSENLSSRQLGE